MRSAIAIPTRPPRATTGRGCEWCCSSPAACCAARTATIRIPGISRTAPTCRRITCCAGSATSRPPLRSLGGGLTISGGEPMVQLAFTRRIFAGAKANGPAHRHPDLRISGRSGRRSRICRTSIIVLLDIKSSDPATYKRVTGRDLAPTLRFAERLASHVEAGMGPLHARSRRHRRSGQCRRHRPFRGAHEERGMGRGSAVPPDGFVQVEGHRPRLQA